MGGEFSKTFGAFLTDAIGLLGQRELMIAAGAVFVVVWLVMWGSAKAIDHKEKHLGSAFSASLILLFLSACLGVAYLALLLKGFIAEGTPPNPQTFLICAGVSALLLLVLVHGAFGTAGWKTAILFVLLVGVGGASAIAAHQFIVGSRATQLPLLAAQVAGLKTEGASLIKSDALKKFAAENGIRFERADLKRRQDALVTTYSTLQQERAKLNVADQAAVTLFNQHAAEYQKEKQYVQARLAEIDALQAAAEKEVEEGE